MILKIKERDIELRYTMRSLILYENIMNKSFNPQTTLEVMVFFLCVLLGSDKQLHLTLDELIDIVDADNQVLIDFTTWLTEEMTKQSYLTNGDEVKVDEGKKKKFR